MKDEPLSEEFLEYGDMLYTLIYEDNHIKVATKRLAKYIQSYFDEVEPEHWGKWDPKRVTIDPKLKQQSLRYKVEGRP